ncbi:hypothetical protein [Taibaiella soli]|nr:hypothetical protein [Taibaiella soli]
MNSALSYLGCNDQIIDQSKSEFSLVSAYLNGIGINWENDQLNIDLKFELFYPAGKRLVLKFNDVFEYDFNYNAAHYFYYVERLKLLKAENRYYISLDPVDQSEKIDAKDNDIIVATNLEAYLIS